MSLFQHCHYEWLACFAGEKLTEQQWVVLAVRLANENPEFKPNAFMHACRLSKLQTTPADRHNLDGTTSNVER